MRVTMTAAQVTGPGHIPDDNWLLIDGELKQMGRQAPGVPSVTKRVGWFDGPAVEFRYPNHFLTAEYLEVTNVASD